MNKIIFGGALGALAMYFLDPDAGRRRRARTRDGVRRAVKVANEAGKVTVRDTAQRAQGLIASTRNLFSHDDVPDGRLVEYIELRDHPWFVATQAHPELKSRPNRPHPLFRDFVGAASGIAGARPAPPSRRRATQSATVESS